MYLIGEVKHTNINHESVNNWYKITAVSNLLTTHKIPHGTGAATDYLHTGEQLDQTRLLTLPRTMSLAVSKEANITTTIYFQPR
jgi:hypothetical protein